MDINVTYAITVCNELEEITKLVNFIHPRVQSNDEILVQYDEIGVTKSVLDYLKIIEQLHTNVKVIGFPLNKDFATFKNNLKKHANGMFIFQCDADEIPSEYLIANMHDLIESNLDIDLFFVPRVNTVDGLTEEHIKRWGWPITKMDTQVGEKAMDTDSGEYKLLKKLGYIIEETEATVKYYKPVNGWPDVQTRLYRRTSEIEWEGKVHERIKGYNTLTVLPLEEQYAIYHPKGIERQSAQNQLYDTI